MLSSLTISADTLTSRVILPTESEDVHSLEFPSYGFLPDGLLFVMVALLVAQVVHIMIY
jgi:hypothetical protein